MPVHESYVAEPSTVLMPFATQLLEPVDMLKVVGPDGHGEPKEHVKRFSSLEIFEEPLFHILLQ